MFKKKQKKEICSVCGKIGIVSVRNKDNTIICSNCYAPAPRLCSYCGEIKQIVRKIDSICFDCYTSEYNKKPEVIAKKCVHTINRRIKTQNSNFTSKDWLYLMNKYEWKCVYCGKKLVKGNRTLDHIIPISRNGEHTIENLIPCCVSCNSSKNNKLLSEWSKFGGNK